MQSKLQMLQPLTPRRWSDAGSASIGNRLEAKPETHFWTWSISAVANLQIIAVVKAISVPTENGRKVIGMAEYIEREALRDALYDADAITMNGVKILNQFPAADVAPIRHGRWIGIPLCGSDDCECSECGNWCNIHVNLCGEAIQKYCPYCGAKMDGGTNNTVG